MTKTKVEQVVFRDVLVLLKEKLLNKHRRVEVIRWINAWIWTIDHQHEHEKRNEEAKKKAD